MAEEKKNPDETAADNVPDYDSPAIEQIITREGMEREVAYAGIPGPSQQSN